MMKELEEMRNNQDISAQVLREEKLQRKKSRKAAEDCTPTLSESSLETLSDA